MNKKSTLNIPAGYTGDSSVAVVSINILGYIFFSAIKRLQVAQSE